MVLVRVGWLRSAAWASSPIERPFEAGQDAEDAPLLDRNAFGAKFDIKLAIDLTVRLAPADRRYSR